MLKQKTYKNGQKTYELLNDMMTVYFKDGLVKAQGPFIDNQMEGEWMFYRQSGELWTIGHFKNNQKHGLWTRFDRLGNIEKKEMFVLGKVDK